MTEKTQVRWRRRLPLAIVVIACATLGLAPFRPQPHVVEKARMLASGELTRAVDIADFLLHGSPWLVLAVLLVRTVCARSSRKSVETS